MLARDVQERCVRLFVAALVYTFGAHATAHSQNVRWLEVPAPDGGVMQAAVIQPHGKGPFPAVIVLHGSTGFQHEYVDIAQSFASAGFVGVAACWFEDGRRESDTRYFHPLHCPGAPAMPNPRSPEAARLIRALVSAVHALPTVMPERIALFGHSRGAAVALNYILNDGSGVRAAILNSGGYPPEVTAQASKIRVPTMLLHGTDDSPANGGVAATDVRLARAFEAALRAAGRSVEVKYYEGAGHSQIFKDKAQRDDEIRRMKKFLRRHLK